MTEEEYQQKMERIDAIMRKGKLNITEEEWIELDKLVDEVIPYEEETEPWSV